MLKHADISQDFIVIEFRRPLPVREIFLYGCEVITSILVPVACLGVCVSQLLYNSLGHLSYTCMYSIE